MIIKEVVLNKSQMRDAISLVQELLYSPQEVQDIITDVTGSEYGSIEDLDVDEVYDQVRQYVISLLSDEDSNITNNDREDLIDAFDIQVKTTYEGLDYKAIDHKLDQFVGQITIKAEDEMDMRSYLNKKGISYMIKDNIPGKRVFKLIYEDTVRKSNGKWTNRGDDGTEHGEFKTKKQADAQRKAMYANGYKGESIIQEGIDDYEIYTLSMDIAIPKGSENELDSDTRYNGVLYGDISKVLSRRGYEMAGDFIDYEEGNTEIYQDSEYEFFND